MNIKSNDKRTVAIILSVIGGLVMALSLISGPSNADDAAYKVCLDANTPRLTIAEAKETCKHLLDAPTDKPADDKPEDDKPEDDKPTDKPAAPQTTTTVKPVTVPTTVAGSTGSRFNVVTGGAQTPNLDGVTVSGCSGRASDNGVYMFSGENRKCTATVNGIPAGSVMTVDAVAFKFGDKVYANHIKAFEVSGSVTIELNNGAALIGTSDRARDRFCSIAATTDENVWGASEWEPLSSWAPCPAGSGSNLHAPSGSAGSGAPSGSSTKERRLTGAGKVGDFVTGEVVQASSVCMGGKFTLNSDGVPSGCPGGEKMDEKPCMVATRDGQAFNGVINPNLGEGGCDK